MRPFYRRFTPTAINRQSLRDWSICFSLAACYLLLSFDFDLQTCKLADYFIRHSFCEKCCEPARITTKYTPDAAFTPASVRPSHFTS